MNYAQLLFPDFSLIFCGYLVCRYTALNRTVWEQVESLGVLLPVPGAAVPVHRAQPAGPGRRLQPDRRRPAAGRNWHRHGLQPAAPALDRARIDRRDHAASAQVAFRFNSFIALALAERLAEPQGCC